MDESASNNTTTQYHEPFGYQEAALVILLSVVIVIVVIGNTLVIAAVITTRRLRTVTNCFVMSLAVADWLVGIFVMPPAVAYLIVGKQFCNQVNLKTKNSIHCCGYFSLTYPNNKPT